MVGVAVAGLKVGLDLEPDLDLGWDNKIVSTADKVWKAVLVMTYQAVVILLPRF